MRNRHIFVVLTFLISLVIFSGCGTQSSTPTPTNTTTYPANIHINVETGENDPEGKIIIDELTINAGTLDRDYTTPAAGEHKAGEKCFLLEGHIKNGYNIDAWVTYHAEGFDTTGNLVATTLDTGPLPGWGVVYVAADSSATFTLHLTWSDNVTGLSVSSQRTTRTVPSPSPANITISTTPCMDDPEGKILIGDLAVVPGTLDDQPYSPLHGKFQAGDPCWLVTGHIENNYDKMRWVAYHAEGYDEYGNEVSFTLDEGPISGVEQVSINRKSYENITLHLSWVENVTNIILRSQMSDQMFP